VPERTLFVYILANSSRILYVGVTNDLNRRMLEQSWKEMSGYTKDHDITRLVYYEGILGPLSAIAREKQIKSWTRKKRIALIESGNPEWKDLSPDWVRPKH
jgi:putative endonuclease